MRIIGWPALDVLFVNIAFYIGYLIRFKGIIELSAFFAYLKLWAYISCAYIILFSVFGLYGVSEKLFFTVLKAVTAATLVSMSIVYIMRSFYGFIPSLVFAFSWGINIILVYGWRRFVRNDSSNIGNNSLL